MSVRRFHLFYLAGMTAAAACGDNGPPAPVEDGGMSATLTILEPPGEQIGLVFGGSAALRVRYLAPGGAPVPGGQVSFAIVADPARSEDSGGASLAATTARADEEGVARVDIVAGSLRTNFRVEANAPGAPPATFYVTVANEGFSALVVTPLHTGDRAEKETDVVEVRLYGSAMSCAALSADAPAPSPYPPRAAETFGQPVSFTALGATEAYSVLAWGRDHEGHVLGEGCVDLAPQQIRPGATLRLDVVVADRPTALAASYELTTSLDMSPVVGELFGPSPAWHAAGCPEGAAQIILDCAIDALDGGDPLDCVVEAPGPDAILLEDTRGVLDPASGCRVLSSPGDITAEILVKDVLIPSGATTPAGVLPYESDRLPVLLTRIDLISSLDVQGGAGWHHLGFAVLGASMASIPIDLRASSRPVLDATLAVQLAGTSVTLGEHAFTLRAGALLREAFVIDGEDVHGLTLDPAGLGSQILAAASSQTGATGCAAVSEAACAAASLPADCLTSACLAVVPIIDAALAEPFARLDAPGLDFTLAGTATGEDLDGDLVLDRLIGESTATVCLSDGAWVPVTGTLSTP